MSRRRGSTIIALSIITIIAFLIIVSMASIIISGMSDLLRTQLNVFDEETERMRENIEVEAFSSGGKIGLCINNTGTTIILITYVVVHDVFSDDISIYNVMWALDTGEDLTEILEHEYPSPGSMVKCVLVSSRGNTWQITIKG